MTGMAPDWSHSVSEDVATPVGALRAPGRKWVNIMIDMMVSNV